MSRTTASSSPTRAPARRSGDRGDRQVPPQGRAHVIEVDSERAQYWLGVGAQPTEPVAAILKVTGDWQKFKGLPGPEGTLRPRRPKTDKKTLFEAAHGRRGRRGRRHPPKKRAEAGDRRRGRRGRPRPAEAAPAAEARPPRPGRAGRGGEAPTDEA